MPINLWVTVITVLLVSGILIFHTFTLRDDQTHSINMASSMTVGMLVSIIAGIIFGAIYKNDLYFSTLISMGIGMLFGGIGGIATGFSSTYEGILSGLMGGMMGAMVGNMISIHQSEILIQLTTLIYTCLAVLLIFRLRKSALKQKWCDHHPFTILILLATYFIIYHHLGPIIPIN